MNIEKIAQLKKNVKTVIISNIIILTIIILTHYLVDQYRDSVESRQISIQASILSTRKNLTDLKTQLSEIEIANKIWEKSKELNEKHDGLQLDEAKTIISLFEKKYDILNLQVKLSTPAELDKEYNTANSVIMYSEVSLNFSSISDENTLKFIDSLLTNFPGFKLVKSLKIAKNTELNQELIEKIRAGHKPSIINSELIFEWRDFKDIKGKEAKDI